MSKVSIIIPACNRPGNLRDALNSIDWSLGEVWVVDDASQSSLGEDITAVCGRYPHVRLLRKKHRSGGSAARNLGAANSTAQWLLFLDDDDALEKSAFAKIKDLINKTIGDVTAWVPDVIGGPSRTSGKVPLSDASFRNRVGGCSGLLIEKSLFVDVGGFDTTFESMQDWDLWLRLINRGALHYSGLPLVHYNKSSTHKITHNLGAKYQGLRCLYFKHRNLWDRYGRKHHLMRLRALRQLRMSRRISPMRLVHCLFKEPLTFGYYVKWYQYP